VTVGKHYLVVDTIAASAAIHRELAQRLFMAPVVTVAKTTPAVIDKWRKYLTLRVCVLLFKFYTVTFYTFTLHNLRILRALNFLHTMHTTDAITTPHTIITSGYMPTLYFVDRLHICRTVLFLTSIKV